MGPWCLPEGCASQVKQRLVPSADRSSSSQAQAREFPASRLHLQRWPPLPFHLCCSRALRLAPWNRLLGPAAPVTATIHRQTTMTTSHLMIMTTSRLIAMTTSETEASFKPPGLRPVVPPAPLPRAERRCQQPPLHRRSVPRVRRLRPLHRLGPP